MSDIRVPPHSMEAEQAVLGSMLLDSRQIDEVAGIVHSEHFYRPAHQKIYQTIERMRATGVYIDALTVKEAMKKESTLDEVGGPPYILDLLSVPSNPKQAKRYAQIVHSAAIYRRLIEVGIVAQNIGYEAPEEVEDSINVVASMMMGLSLSTSDDTKPVDKVVDGAVSTIMNGGQFFITPYNYPKARFSPGDLVILSAGPSAGKTAMAMDWVDEWSKEFPVTFLEYEMPEQNLVMRLLSKYAKVPYERLQDGILNAEEQVRVKDAGDELRKRQLRIKEIYCDNVTLFAMIRKEAMQGVKMVVIDHAGLVPLKGLQNGRNDAKNIGVQLSNPLKRLASELGIIIVLLVQLSREGRKDPAAFPKMHHLRDSGEYEQDAAVVLMLWNDNGLDDAIDRRATLREKSGICLDTETFDNTFNLVRIAIEKNRNGSKGAKYLMYHGDSFSYEDREKAELRVVQNKLIPEEVVGHECACS